jgi:hypothetical protein
MGELVKEYSDVKWMYVSKIGNKQQPQNTTYPTKYQTISHFIIEAFKKIGK